MDQKDIDMMVKRHQAWLYNEAKKKIETVISAW